MSLLNQLFNRGVFGAKCKTCLSLAISRIKLLQNKRDLQLKHMRKEIAQFLQAGQEPIARIRVEHIIREQNIWAAYEILELFCEFVLARVPILESQKFKSSERQLPDGYPVNNFIIPNSTYVSSIYECANFGDTKSRTALEKRLHVARECPSELREAVASIIFAAPRCSDVPDLLQIKNLFSTKYGKEFVTAASELRPDSSVNRAIIEKLSVSAPSGEIRLKVLKEIAQEHSVEWDSSSTEAEFSKKHEDLLAGSKQVCAEAAVSQSIIRQASIKPSPSNGAKPVLLTNAKQASQHQQAPGPVSKAALLTSSEIEPSAKNCTAGSVSDIKTETTSRPSDVLERARAAIASAECAIAAARAAAELVNVKFGSMKLEGTSS
ncbi:Vacuolar protein sorting-associated protein Ist1 - like 2 [Theobroma cacao]|nr:Vacuolar protein sorting-associated protein Ist1 - like 2 [Theobroma cacao]